STGFGSSRSSDGENDASARDLRGAARAVELRRHPRRAQLRPRSRARAGVSIATRGRHGSAPGARRLRMLALARVRADGAVSARILIHRGENIVTTNLMESVRVRLTESLPPYIGVLSAGLRMGRRRADLIQTGIDQLAEECAGAGIILLRGSPTPVFEVSVCRDGAP